MSALKSACLAIVNSMSADDQQSVLTKLDQYLAMGVPQAQAQIMAVTDAMEELKAEQDEFMGLVAQQHPDLFAVQYSVKRAGDFTYTQEKTGRFAGRVQVFGDADRIRFLAKATPSKFDKDSVTFKAVDAANVIRTLKNQPRVDAAIAREIAELMKLTEQELAITNLEYQTGQPKDRAFVTPLVGGLPEVVKFLTERYKATGAPLLDIGVEADRAKLAKLIAAEALAAIRSSGSAVEWYDVTIARLLGMASLKYPELQNNLNAQSAFRVALAITSQGLDVETNLKFTMQVYEQFRSSAPSEAARRFPIVGQGESQGVMEKNFLLTNDMLSDMGPDFMRRFLKTPFTVSELNSAGFSPEGELVDEAVLGSSVLGPKIGFGFYSNLNGNFEPVTMDMWFMRTVGRLTGKISAFDQKKFDAQLARFRQGLDQTGSDGLYAASLDPALVAAARTDVDKAIELARVIKRAHEKDYKDNRAAFDSGRRVKTQIVLAADTMVFSLDKPTDVPQNGTERRLLRDVVKRTVALLEQHYGERVPPAALQALIWYPEQEFYKAMGVKLRVTSQDYAGAVQQLLKGEGYSESDLRSAAQSGSRRARQMAARAERSGSQAPGKGLGRFDALQDEERDNFLRQRYEREQLRQEAEDPKRKRVVFEVAPDPDNTKLSEAWNKLDEATRLEVSNAVARRIVPEVMREFETDGVITEQIGSYENDTNPSFSLLLKKGDPVEIARFMGFILSQKEMVVVSPKPFQGGSPVGAIAIEVGQLSTIEIDEIYQELRKITVNGQPVVGGQSTINGLMSVLNYSDVPTDQLAQLIDNQLLGAYIVEEDLVYAAFPNKQEYDYASSENVRGNKGKALRERARVLRGRVASVLQEELNRARRQSGGGARGRQGAGGKVPAQQPGAQEAGSGQDVQRSNRLSPLPGAPNVPGFHGPDPRLVAVAEQYARDNGIDLKRQSEYVKIDEDRAKRIAQAYEAMPNAPQDPAVREAYANLIQQTTTQYRALVDAGYKFWFVDLGRDDNIDYIDSPWNAMRDLRANQVLGVFPTDAGFGSGDKVRDNPLELTVTEYMWPVGDLNGPLKRVLANDLFRAVHDAFGHGLEGAGFRAQGEENAWQAHVRLFTGSAVGAITSETRGQNSAVNFGKNAEFNKTASAADTIYADQKVGLMPEWTWTEGRAGDINLTVAGFDNASGNFNPDLDPYWIKQGQKEINGERVSDADYYTAVAEYANQWRVQELLEKLGWVRRGSSNVSSSVYFEKSIELAEPNEDGQDSLTYEVRVSDHDDRYPADGTVEQRVQINFRSERADWADADITPDMSTADAVATLEDLLPFENSALGIQRSVRTDTPEFKAWFGDWDAVRKATMPREAATLSEAIERAASFVGKPILNISTGLEATVSRGNLGKMTSGSATLKSTSARAHALAVANADRLFTNALLESSSADKRGEPTIAAIRRYVAPMIDESGRLVAVKMTVKETTGPKEPNPLYTIETLEIAKPALEAPETGIERGIDSRRQPPQAGFTGTVAQMLTDSNPVTVSKVVDANGAPLVVYHGSSDKGIEVFESEDGRFYFTDNKAVADGYGRKKGERKNAQTYSVYLSMQRPDVYDMKGASWYKDGVASEVYGYIMDAKDAGFDGVILENFVDGATEQRSALSTIYVVFDPTQIKSIDNDGAWSTTNPNISRSARTPLGFYSALVRGIENLPTKQAEAGAWKAQIKGLVNKGLVKADEIEWSGVNDYLDLQKGKITKDAVMEYLSQNGVRVEEVVLGGKDLAGQWEQFKDGWRRKIGNRWMHVWEPDFEGKVYGKGPSGLTQKFASVEEGKAYFDGMDGTSSTQPAKYGKYQLPGGENYREVLLTLPPSSVVEPVVAEGRWRLRDKFTGEFMRADGAKVIGFNSEAEARKAIEQLSEPGMDQFVPGFNSRHWSQKNILAHIRVNDRVDADGKRVLFVEELQSDWSQEGRKKGFAPDRSRMRVEAARDVDFPELTIWRAYDASGEVRGVGDTREQALADVTNRYNEIPAAPFVTKTDGWLNLALKRIMVMAAEGGYDKVAFVNGEQSADRYDLSQQVNYVQWNPGSLPGSRLISLEEKGGTIIGVSVQADGTVYDSSVDGAEGKRLDEVLGKEIAEKIMAEENGDLRGLDLKVGGRGMKTFYDSIVPAAIKKLLPKVGGGQMGMVTLDVAGLDQPTSFKGVREGGKGVVQGSMPNGNIVYLQQDETWGPRSTAKRFSYLDDAYDAAAALIGKVGRITQPGFDVTPAMREKVAEGLPQFSRRQVDTPEFKQWFGDSKVVDADGKPLVDVGRVLKYVKEIHPDQDDFTREDPQIEPNIKRFKSYKLERISISDLDAALRKFDVLEELVDDYAKLDTRFPPIVYDPDRKLIIDGMHRSAAAKLRGDDSITALVGTNTSTQIKSAIGNNGQFDPADPGIRRSARRATEAFAPELISEYNVPVYKSREKLISMKIDDFLKMARDGRVQDKAEDVSNLRGRGSRFSSLPYLTTWPGDDGVLKVNGHEGRHRARQLKAEGFDEMPVILKANIRWSEQDSPGKFDYVKNWPTALEAEDSSERIPMPVSREQATQPYETEAMGVQFSTRPALASYLEGRNRTLSRANPQSVLESDIEKATQAINLAVREIKAGNKEQLEIPIGPVPHVLHMLGAPMQMLQIYTSVLRKVLVDKHSEDFAGVSAAEFVRAIYQPVAVLQERAKDEHEVLTNLTNAKGVPIVVALKADTVDLDGKTKTTTIKSAYSRDQMMAKGHLAAQLAAKKVKYADLAKVLELEEKSPTVAKAFGRAVPAKSATAVPLSKTKRALPAPVGSDLLQQDRPGINLGSSSGTGLGSDRLGLSSASLFAKAVAKAINGGIIPGYGSLVQFLADQYQGAPADMPQFSIRNGNSAWDEPQANWFDDFVYKAQDKLIDLKRVIESIKKTVGQVTDDINAYLQEELFHGRAATRVRDFGKDELEPLMEEIKAQGLTMEQVEEFLHARHAKEANDLIRNRQGGMQDGGSGMTDADADAYMRSLSPSDLAKLNAVAVKVDSITATTRQLYADYGLESQDAVDAWAQMFQHYIPLYREDDGSMGIGQGFNVKGKEVKGRVGSTRRVVDVLGNIALQREKVIVRGEKNRVAQALVGLAQANPNPDFWDVRAQAPTEKVYDERTKKIIDRVLPNWKNQPNVLTAKVKNANGDVHEVAVEFNEDNERALRLAAALKNLDAGALEGLLGVSAKITRYFSSVNTQYNPVFGFVNVIRDVQAAMVNLAETPLKGKQRRIAKDTLAAVAGIYSGARGGAGNQWTTLWKQFEEDGGSTGYRELFKSSADRAEALRNTLDPDAWMNSKWGKIFTAGGTLKVPMSAAKKGASWIFDWLSDYNEAMENGVRLATYKAALDQGLSRQEAASLAKNLTVNFNRKGQVGQQAGAVYAFFNAAMQGTARIGETIFTMDGGDLKTLRLSKTGQKVVYGGILLGSIQALALAAAGFSDDDPPDFVRERNLIIPIGDKKYLTIPMPLGLHVFPGLGRHAAEFAMGGFKDPTKRAASVFGMFADAFNPIGNAGMSLQTIAPTAIDPLVALSENKDWSGKPIARKGFNPAEPGYLQWKDSATGLSKSIAYGINWLTGGNDYKAGVISPTPDQIDFLIGQVTGGVGREISKIEQTTANLARGEEVAPYKLPLAGRLYGNAKSQASEGNTFYANSKRLNELETEIKLMEKDGKRQEAQELRKLPEAQLMRQANVIERQIQRLKKEKRELIDQGAERSAITAKDAAITDAMSRLNRSMERVKLAA